MGLILLLPVVVGALVVLQGNLNRLVAAKHGLAFAMGVNTIVFALSCLGLIAAVRAFPGVFPAGFAWRTDGYRFAIWHLFPGLCGFALVAGIPFAIAHLGPVRVFVGVVVAQVVASVLWEAIVDGHRPAPARLAGVGLALVGVLLASRRG